MWKLCDTEPNQLCFCKIHVKNNHHDKSENYGNIHFDSSQMVTTMALLSWSSNHVVATFSMLTIAIYIDATLSAGSLTLSYSDHFSYFVRGSLWPCRCGWVWFTSHIRVVRIHTFSDCLIFHVFIHNVYISPEAMLFKTHLGKVFREYSVLESWEAFCKHITWHVDKCD